MKLKSFFKTKDRGSGTDSQPKEREKIFFYQLLSAEWSNYKIYEELIY